MAQIFIEGYTSDEVFLFPLPDLEALIFTGEPVELKIGSAKILAQFQKTDCSLTLELAQIDGGGEGVLLTLALLVEKYAQLTNLTEIHWIVHAVHCAKPNVKLRRMLIRKGFQLKEMDGVGSVYFRNQKVVHHDGKNRTAQKTKDQS